MGATVAAPTQPEPPKRHRRLIGRFIAAVLAMAVVAGWYFGLDRQKSPLPTDTNVVVPKVAPPPTVSPTSTPPAASIAGPAPRSIDPEMVFWQTMSASTTAADFEEYLRKYPQGQFAGLARNRLAALRAPPQVTAPNPPSEPSPTSTPSERSAGERAFATGSEAENRGNVAEANRWYRKAADLGNPDGQAMVGYYYQNVAQNCLSNTLAPKSRSTRRYGCAVRGWMQLCAWSGCHCRLEPGTSLDAKGGGTGTGICKRLAHHPKML
jgi:hypothetical protein